MKTTMDNPKITIIILTATLSLFLTFFILDKVEESKQGELMKKYQEGYDDGIADTITIIFQQTENCQVSTLNIHNFSKNIFDVSCLQDSSFVESQEP
jgi:hypothetical protein